MVSSTTLTISSGLWSTRNAGVTLISARSFGEDHTGVKTRFLRSATPGVQQHASTSSPLFLEGDMQQALQTQEIQPSSHACVDTCAVENAESDRGRSVF